MKPQSGVAFDARAFLDSAGIDRKVVEYRRAEVIFAQGDPSRDVLYIQKGGVKLSVLSKAGREAVVAILGAGEFFGEGCLAGQHIRMGSATATVAAPSSPWTRTRWRGSCTRSMRCRMGSSRTCWRAISGSRQDLVDQLFNSSEKRLARELLLLARYGKQDKPVRPSRQSRRRRWRK